MTSSPGHEGGDRREEGLCGAGGDGDLVIDVVADAVERRHLVGDPWRSSGVPGHRRVLVAAGEHGAMHGVEQRGRPGNRGNPCDRLIAPQSAASLDMTVKMVVPTQGSLESMATGEAGMVWFPGKLDKPTP